MRNKKQSVWMLALWSFAAILVLPTISSFATLQSEVGSNENSECEEACDEAYNEAYSECDSLYDECERFCSLATTGYGEYETCMYSCNTQYDYCTSGAAQAWAACRRACQ